jgi:hypothetical protein
MNGMSANAEPKVSSNTQNRVDWIGRHRERSQKTKVKQVFVVLLLAACALNSGGRASAQESKENGVDSLIDTLRKTPATEFDLGLSRIEAKMLSTILASKPDALKQGRFLFLDVLYLEVGHMIRISFGHRASSSSLDSLSSECRNDIALMQAALTPNTPMTTLSQDLPPEQKDQICGPVTSNFENTANAASIAAGEVFVPGANICSRITMWAEVLTADGKHNASCSKDFYSPEVTREMKQ